MSRRTARAPTGGRTNLGSSGRMVVSSCPHSQSHMKSMLAAAVLANMTKATGVRTATTCALAPLHCALTDVLGTQGPTPRLARTRSSATRQETVGEFLARSQQSCDQTHHRFTAESG